MKTISTLALLASSSVFAIDVNILRSIPKKRILGIYTSVLLNDNDTTTQDVHFAKAMQIRADKNEIPDHVVNAIIHQMTTVDENDRTTWDNCPAGDCDVPVTLESIWGYGCWCNFPVLGKGSGPVLDEYDRVCNSLSRCNRCVQRDAETVNEICDIATESFNINFRWSMEDMALVGDCEVSNDNDCQKHLCSCEFTFISKMLDVLWSGDQLQTGFYHTDPNWNHRISCKGGESVVPTIDPEMLTSASLASDNEILILKDMITESPLTHDQGHDHEFICCGFYPDRKSYNSDTWECCETETARNPFRHAEQICCNSDGSVVDMGELCP